LVASNDPAVAGLVWAADQGIPTSGVDHKDFGRDRAAFEENLLKRVLAAQPDILCLAGFMRILSPTFIGHFAGKMLNIHPSLLPKYPGLHTHQRALEAGVAKHGCTVHLVTTGVDEGPILGQAEVDVLPDDDEDRLGARVLEQEHQLYTRCLADLVRGVNGSNEIR
jgi:phosphoribosylglycinamide formyltransferase-1